VRHALIPIQLVHEARAANGPALPERQLEDAPPDPPVAPEPRSRGIATLFRRARALVVRPT
jgi:hypothetical protein